MIGHEDEELLQHALDGALSADETERLRARLAAEPDLRARADSLERLVTLVDAHGRVQPPAEFTDRVMAAVATVPPARPAWHRRLASVAGAIGRQLFPGFAHHSGQSTGHQESFRKAGMAGGGVIVAKKALWGIAGLAVVIVLVVVYFNGTRSVDQGAQGTIGAADRYRGAQPSSVSAKAADAQAFLQSDTFDKLVKDKDVRNLLADHLACAVLAKVDVQVLNRRALQDAMADGAAQAALGTKALQDAMEDGAVQAALGTKALQDAMGDGAVQNALRQTSLQNALLDGKARSMLTQAGMQTALQQVALVRDAVHGGKALAAQSPEFANAINAHNVAFMAAIGDDAFLAAMKDSGKLFSAFLTNDACVAALNARAQLMTAVMADAALQASMNGSSRQIMSSLFGDADVMNLIKTNTNLHVAAFFGDATFQAAVHNTALVSALHDNPGARAAFSDGAAMDAALKAMERR